MSYLKKNWNWILIKTNQSLEDLVIFLSFVLQRSYCEILKTHQIFQDLKMFRFALPNLLPGFLIPNLITVQIYWNSNLRTKTANTNFFSISDSENILCVYKPPLFMNVYLFMWVFWCFFLLLSEEYYQQKLHSSEIRGLCIMKLSFQTIQNLLFILILE